MTAIIAVVAVGGLALTFFTRYETVRIEAAYPAIGEFVDAGGFRMHALHVPAPADADLPPLVFVHGASGNLRDQSGAFRTVLQGRAEMLFVDRPGHGWSERGGTDNDTPDGQARALARTMWPSASGVPFSSAIPSAAPLPQPSHSNFRK